MKRGLKAHDCRQVVLVLKVTTYSPMKRGLKGLTGQQTVITFPVTTYSPMKRGLKVRRDLHAALFFGVLQPIPR